MKPKYPAEVMHAKLVYGRVHCQVCLHFTFAFGDWCHQHQVFPSERPSNEIIHQNNDLYCADYQFTDREPD